MQQEGEVCQGVAYLLKLCNRDSIHSCTGVVICLRHLFSLCTRVPTQYHFNLHVKCICRLSIVLCPGYTQYERSRFYRRTISTNCLKILLFRYWSRVWCNYVIGLQQHVSLSPPLLALVVFLAAIYFFSVALRPNAGHGLLILEVSRSHTTTHHSRQDSTRRVISSSQRPLPDNTQHSQQINIHALGGIRTHDLSRRAAPDLRLRPRGHWDRLLAAIVRNNSVVSLRTLPSLFPHT